MNLPVPGLFRGPKTLSIMPTYACPAACEHCASMSHPKARENLALQAMLSAIDQAKALGFYNVVFTGGEATLRWRDLLAAIRHASGLGFPVRLVSNAHWAVSVKSADRRLDALLEAGLTEINYSTGDEHARFVPLERVVEGCLAAVRRRLKAWVMVELRAARAVTAASVTGHPRIAALAPEDRALIEIVESPWMPLDPGLLEDYPPGVAADNHNFKSFRVCSNVLQTYTIQADGRVGACCGIGMRQIPELSVATVDQPDFLSRAVEAAEGDFLKLWLHYLGPERVLAWAAARDPSIRWEGMYAHHCQACARIYRDEAVRRLVREHYEEMIAEVLQAAWLDEHHVPSQSRGMAERRRACAQA
ncbi:radical SAM protein [Chromobacterium sp. TRC.1.1.SA]|uniref:Radical SAM protein n=1 Tax=Chromobacterium indicum TaxID=3110228 RepID=A0ABV0CGT1_9NEIS